MALRLLLVEKVPEVRALLAHALRLHPSFSVVGEAGDGATAIALAGVCQPDLIVLDLGLPDLAGRELLTGLRAAAPAALVVVVSAPEPPDRDLASHAFDACAEKTGDVRYVIDLLEEIGARVTRSATIRLRPDRREVALARRFVVGRCVEWGKSAAADAAAIVVSELVANALVHVQSGCELTVGLRGDVLRIAVVDHGGGMPDVQRAGTDDDHGRGLLLVSILCTAWGTEPHGTGKSVWAELRADATTARLRPPHPGAGSSTGRALQETARVDAQSTVA
ncbi:MAG: response regulator [Actinomycetota bacterium]|nr:response regulator [Actinomycetota bacterium]